jgi:hypothetical protein
VSGTGGYGSLSWTYDANGNVINRVSGGTTYTHTYNPGTNQIAGATWTGNTETFSYTGNGNISGETQSATDEPGCYGGFKDSRGISKNSRWRFGRLYWQYLRLSALRMGIATMTASRAKASLRISTKLYKVIDLNTIFGTVPSNASDRGDPLSKQNPLSDLHSHTHWSLKAPIDESHDIAEHISWIVGFLEAHKSILEELQKACTIDLFCFYTQVNDQGGFVLPSDLCLRLGKLELPITFDIYCTAEEGRISPVH